MTEVQRLLSRIPSRILALLDHAVIPDGGDITVSRRGTDWTVDGDPLNLTRERCRWSWRGSKCQRPFGHPSPHLLDVEEVWTRPESIERWAFAEAMHDSDKWPVKKGDPPHVWEICNEEHRARYVNLADRYLSFYRTMGDPSADHQ